VLLLTSYFAHVCADFEDVPAATSSKPTDSDWFGPRIPLTGLTGRLKLGSPDVFGCSPLDFGELPAATQHSDRRVAGDDSNSDSNGDTASATAYSQLSEAATGAAARDGPLPIITLLARSLPLDASNCHFDTKVLVLHRIFGNLEHACASELVLIRGPR
jgi:hypothetical protein